MTDFLIAAESLNTGWVWFVIVAAVTITGACLWAEKSRDIDTTIDVLIADERARETERQREHAAIAKRNRVDAERRMNAAWAEREGL